MRINWDSRLRSICCPSLRVIIDFCIRFAPWLWVAKDNRASLLFICVKLHYFFNAFNGKKHYAPKRHAAFQFMCFAGTRRTLSERLSVENNQIIPQFALGKRAGLIVLYSVEEPRPSSAVSCRILVNTNSRWLALSEGSGEAVVLLLSHHQRPIAKANKKGSEKWSQLFHVSRYNLANCGRWPRFAVVIFIRVRTSGPGSLEARTRWQHPWPELNDYFTYIYVHPDRK